MKSIKGTRTEKNLLAAFAGESQARNRYTFFSKVAKKEGYEQISAIFLETAENEKQHAKLFFKLLEGGDVEITAAYPAGVIGTTEDNLKAAAQADVLVLSIKPQILDKVLKEIKPSIQPNVLILSIIAGAPIQKISDGLGTDLIVR